jgi:hypothetical protein
LEKSTGNIASDASWIDILVENIGASDHDPSMTPGPSALPSDFATALSALQAEREARLRVEAERDVAQMRASDLLAAAAEAQAEAANAQAEAANARAKLSDTTALIAHLELRIEKLKRELYGQRSERTARLVEQLELELEDLVAAATEDELAAQAAPSRASGRSANPGRRISSASASSSRRRRLALAAADRGWPRSART